VDAYQRTLETHFRKKLAITGGLLMLAYGGPGKWALMRREADARAKKS
jgi:uncharacterized membrane protein YphA (DoxX/SURF4 family)